MANFREIAQEIVNGALTTSTAEFVELCGGDIEAATNEIVRWYTADEGGEATFTNVYGEPMRANGEEFRRYVEYAIERAED